MQTGINAVRAGVITANELRQEMGYDTRPGDDELQPQVVGGRPGGTADGEDDARLAPGAPTNGSGRGNGARGAIAGGELSHNVAKSQTG